MGLQPAWNMNESGDRYRVPRRTVLLVEDEPFVREATLSILESAGYQVIPAGDAVAAIRAYEESQWAIDLVMTDMVLPGRTGEQLGEEIRQRSPDVKVLVTSGYCDGASATEQPQSQTYFLAKPYTRRGLVEKIEKIFEVPLRRAAGQAG
jgi:DNA-binding NtrC family response regulator